MEKGVGGGGGVGGYEMVKGQNFKEEDWWGDDPVAAGPVCSLYVD